MKAQMTLLHCCTAYSGLALSLLASAAMVGCSGGETGVTANIEAGGEATTETGGETPTVTNPVGVGDSPFAEAQRQPAPSEADLHPIVVFQTSLGAVKVKLDAKNAPFTVDNFLQNYVERGHYNDTIFHYVDGQSIAVGGGYDTQGNLKAARAEIPSEAHNGLKNTKGTIAMARAADYAHSATCQFFFNLQDNAAFDFQSPDSSETYGYCVFGEVVEGWDVVEKIAAVPVRETEISPKIPAEPVVIKSATLLR